MTQTEANASPKDAALKLALEALDFSTSPSPCVEELQDDAIAAIKEALAQPEEQHSCDKQEPVAWYDTEEYGNIRWASEWSLDEGTPLYTHPPVPYVTPSRTAQPKEPEQEPVAWFWKQTYTDGYEWKHMADNQADADKFLPHQVIPLYTTPPQRTWVGLDEEDDIDWEEGGSLRDLVEAVEAKLKEKNT